MKKLFVMIALFAIIATSAFAHNVHALTKMGIVKIVHGDDLTLTMSDGDLEKVELSNKTSYIHADNHSATKAELAVGMRVVVKMTPDGKTAASVKMSAAPKKK
jgi:uncharacterized GH25 family protein